MELETGAGVVPRHRQMNKNSNKSQVSVGDGQVSSSRRLQS